jgi:RND family efflux transporter MFP subunit
VRRLHAFCLLVLAAVGCRSTDDESVETRATVPVSVATARVDRIDARLTAIGTVDPLPGRDWTIVAPQAGRVLEMPKLEGAAVRKGDLLVRFDAPGLVADGAAKTAERRQAEARLTQAQQAAARLDGLFERGIAARKDVEEAQKELRDAEAAQAAAQAGEAAARTLADRVVVRAPFDGVVARRWHNPGDTVEAAPSDPVLRVVDPTRLQVVAQVSAADAGRIVAGRTAQVRVATGNDSLAGHVVGGAGAVDPATGTAPVRIALDGGAAAPPGTAVQIEIVAESHAAAVVVPASAIVRDGADAFVYVDGGDGKAQRRKVTLGLDGGDAIEIASGVQGGERVVVRGQQDLPDGAAITVEP